MTITLETLHAVNRLLIKLKRVVVVLILIAAAWITFDVYRKRSEAPALGFETFVVENSSVRISFSHPKNATEGTAGSLDENFAVAFAPPAREAGVFVRFSAARGKSGAALSAEVAALPRTAISIQQTDIDVGGHRLQRLTYRTQSPDGAVYEAGDVRGSVRDRFIYLQCSFKVRDVNSSLPDGQVSQWRNSIGVILSSLRIETAN